MADRRADAWLASAAASPDLLFLGAPTSALSLSLSQAHLTPAAFRQALARFPVWDATHGVDLEELSVRDLGDEEMSGDPLVARARLEARIAGAAGAASSLVVCGGDNSITYAGVRGLAAAAGRALGSGRVGLLTLDAHHDLREPEPAPSNGSPVYELLRDGLPGTCICQVGISGFANARALGERAAEAGIAVYTVEDIRARGIENVVEAGLGQLDCEVVYLDLDLDVLDRAFAPACPASLPGGLTPGEVAAAAFRAGADARVRVLDLVEVDSAADVAGITTRAAALMFLSFASGVAQSKR